MYIFIYVCSRDRTVMLCVVVYMYVNIYYVWEHEYMEYVSNILFTATA